MRLPEGERKRLHSNPAIREKAPGLGEANMTSAQFTELVSKDDSLKRHRDVLPSLHDVAIRCVRVLGCLETPPDNCVQTCTGADLKER